jgi:hypothetical protein
MSLIEQGNGVLAAWETQTQVYFAPVGRLAKIPSANIQLLRETVEVKPCSRGSKGLAAR